MPEAYMQFGNLPRLSISYPSGATEEEKEQLYWDRLSKGELLPQTPVPLPEEDGSLLRTGVGLGTEIVVGEGAKMLGTAWGSPLGLPGMTVGYIAGGIVGGISGSLARQRIADPDAPISYGQVLSDTLINLIPFGLGRAGKAVGIATRVVGHGAAGAGIGAGAATVESLVDEGKMPDSETLINAGITGGALGMGLGVSGELASKFYRKYAGQPVSKFDADVKAGDPDAVAMTKGIDKKSEEAIDTSNAASNNFFLKLKQEFVDRRAVLQKFQEEIKGKLGSEFKEGSPEDVYISGRMSDIGADSELKHIMELSNQDMTELRKASSILKKKGETEYSVKYLHDKSNQYMHARHALEYHKAERTKTGKPADSMSGKTRVNGEDVFMTDELAQSLVDKFESSNLATLLAPSLKIRRSMADLISETQLKGGLINKADIDKYRLYDEYVPLNRQLDKDRMLDHMGIPSTDLRSSHIFRRKGKEGAGGTVDVYENLIARNMDAVYRSLKNQEGRAMKRLLELSKKEKLNLEDIATVRPVRYPSRSWGKKGEKGRPIKEVLKDGDVSVFEDGKQYVISFAPGPYQQIAATLKGMDKVELGLITKGALLGNRVLGSLYTRYNPAFWGPNMVRDRLESFINTVAKIGFRNSLEIVKPWAVVKDVRTVYRNLSGKQNVAQNLEDKAYAEFKPFSVGNLGMSTSRGINDDLMAIAPGSKLSAKIKENRFSKLIDRINSIFEDTTRFSTFKAAKKAYDSMEGMTPERATRLAAIASRDASFDPKLGGTKIKHIGAAFLFANPAIQGSRNMFRTLTNKKVLAGTTTSFIGTSILLDWWNSSIDPDWKNKIKGGPDKSGWRLNKHFIILNPKQDETGELTYSQIPVPYPLIPIKTVSDFISDLARGRDTNPGQLAKEVRNSIIDGYSPTGGTLVPTLLDKAIVGPQKNKDGLGRDIIPQYMFEMDIPDSEKYGAWMAETYGGQIMIDIAQEATKLGMEVSPETLEYIYENSLGGLGGEMKRLMNAVVNLSNGKEVRRNEWPVLRRFLGRSYADGFEQLTGITPDVSHFEREQSTMNVKNSRRHFDLLKELRKGSSAEERLQIYENIIQGENKSVQRRLKKSLQDMRLGITKTDRDVRALGVENGMRASFFQKQMSRMTPEQAREYVADQTSKKIMTPEVKRQMRIADAFKALY